MEKSARGKACYLCGKGLKSADVPPVKMVLDRRPRLVHPGCKTAKEKADSELGWLKRKP